MIVRRDAAVVTALIAGIVAALSITASAQTEQVRRGKCVGSLERTAGGCLARRGAPARRSGPVALASAAGGPRTACASRGAVNVERYL